MCTVRRKRAAYFAGCLAALLLAVGASAACGSDAIDQIITGSIDPTAPAAATGSTQFRADLAILDGGDPRQAFELADKLANSAERKALQWAALYSSKGQISPADISSFASRAPDFAPAFLVKTRLEQGLITANAGSVDIIKYLSGAMPNTLDAQIALAGAYRDTGQKARAARIAHSIWANDFLDAGSETKVMAALGDLLGREDHWARALHLMMNDRSSAVERLLPYLSPAQKSLAVARNAVSRNDKDAKKLLDAVDPALRDNPVYLFSRAQRARQFELWNDAIAYLNKGTADAPDAEQWWYERRTLVRQLLAAGNAKLAYKAAAGYRSGPEGRLVEAHFHAGWIALSFLGDASSAAAHFEAMLKLSTLPDSVSQADYWLGRAREALGYKLGANQAYAAAANYGTIYYGLLARSKLGLTPVALREPPAWRQNQPAFDANDLVRAVRLLAANGQAAAAAPLLRNYAQGLKAGADLLLAARLAQEIDAHYLAISIADIADKRGAPLDLFSFPKDGLPATKLAEIDKAAIYAITRQESKFQLDAVSASGARGLMQLMPGTAKETARKIGVAYSPGRLTSDGSYNALLGSTYLAMQLQTYQGSLVLAAAAYNAGAGNANKWITAYGDPRAANVDPVVWVELIPFLETRKYVQRVLGNYLVYRARLGQNDMSLEQALRRIGS